MQTRSSSVNVQMSTLSAISPNSRLQSSEVSPFLSLKVGTQLTELDDAAPTRIVLIPSFAKTGQVVLLCLETLECKAVGFEVPSWDGDEAVKPETDVKMEES